MKMLTTLTAVVALVAGMSIASAQTTTPKAGAMGSSSSSGMQKQAVSGTGKFCIEQTPGGALNCKFADLASCQKEGKASNVQCKPNPNSGATTGAK
jgi:hypothetical protein